VAAILTAFPKLSRRRLKLDIQDLLFAASQAKKHDSQRTADNNDEVDAQLEKVEDRLKELKEIHTNLKFLLTVGSGLARIALVISVWKLEGGYWDAILLLVLRHAVADLSKKITCFSSLRSMKMR